MAAKKLSPEQPWLQRARRVMLQPAITCDVMSTSSAAAHQSHPLALRTLYLPLILAIGPFIVRRIILLGDDDYLHWIAIDYLSRCISVGGVILGFRSDLLRSVHQKAPWPLSLQMFLLLFFAEYAEQTFGQPVIQHYLRFTETSAWPPILAPALRSADVSFGLLFAVFVEELVFRKLLFAVIERWRPQRFQVVMISAAIFGLIHFTSGIVDTMVNAFVHGIFFGLAYWKTRRLSICVASHYLIDLFIFIAR